MKNYRKVNTVDYIRENNLTVVKAQKFGTISVERDCDGKRVESWSEDSKGRPILEKVSRVSEGQCILTKTDDFGVPIIDAHGHKNQWIADESVIEKKYDEVGNGIYKAKAGAVQLFAITEEPLILTQWGEEMKMPMGSYINITDPNDMYGVNPRDFNDTYRVII